MGNKLQHSRSPSGLKSIHAKPRLPKRLSKDDSTSQEKPIISTGRSGRMKQYPFTSHLSSPFDEDEESFTRSRVDIELSAKHFDSHLKLRDVYLMNTIYEFIGQRSSRPRPSYLEFLVDLTKLEHEFGQQVASQVTSTEDFSYHSNRRHFPDAFMVHIPCELHEERVSFLVKQSQVGCSVSERTIRSFCEAFCYLCGFFPRVQRVHLSNCTLPTQVALLHTLLSAFNITFARRSYEMKFVCTFSKDFLHLKENEFMSIINETKPLVVQGEVSKRQFQELISYSFMLLTEYNEKIIQAVVEHGADVNITDKDGKTALLYATEKDNEKIALALIKAGADVNMTDKDGKTALFYAINRHNEKIAHALIEAGADVNMTDKDGKTALFYAINRHNEKIAHALIEAGADVNTKDEEGNTVLLYVFHRPNNIRRMCKILLEAGASLCETTTKQESIFHLALNNCLKKILSSHTGKRQKHLLWLGILDAFKLFPESSESKVAVNKRDMDLNSPLHLWASLVLASTHQYRKDVFDGCSFERMLKVCLELLVKCGVKLNYSNKQEQTPLHVCRTWTAVKLLLDAGAKPDVTDSSECTPLLAAAKRNTCIEKDSERFYPDVTQSPKEFWKEVINKKLDPWTADRDGNSVLSILVTKGANRLAKALIEIACKLRCVQSDAVGVPLLFTICRDKSVDKEWKVDLVGTLLKYRYSLAQKRANDKDTALHCCCRNMVELPEESAKISVHWKIAQHLILCGADVETIGKEDKSCLDMAESCPVVKMLLSMPIKMEKVHPVMDSWKKVSARHREQLVRVSRGFSFKQIDTVCYFNESLDNGTFGLVFVGINTQDGKEVAVKRVERVRVDTENTQKEIEELRRVTSCNKIIQCLLCTSDKDFLYVILELMEGNLDDLLSDENHSHISQETKLCRDICTGLDYLHNRDIVHKGIKPSNILYQVLPSINLKLAFFGLRSQMCKEQQASYYTDTYECLIKEKCWMASEVLQSQSHSKSSDVFSCGLVIHYLLSNKKHPFGVPGSSEESLLAVSIETVDNIAQDKMELDETLSSDAKDLLKEMLDHTPTRRTSISNALKHGFFQSKPEDTKC